MGGLGLGVGLGTPVWRCPDIFGNLADGSAGGGGSFAHLQSKDLPCPRVEVAIPMKVTLPQAGPWEKISGSPSHS